MTLRSDRLVRLASLVPVCDCVADIGTDHGMLPVFLVSSGRCSKAIAADVRPGPLSAARRCVNEAGLGEKVSLRLGSGLSVIQEREAPVTVIAGMGGSLIAQLLGASIETARRLPLLILQANTMEAELRRFLWDEGFQILDEQAVADGRHVYLILIVRWTGAVSRSYTALDCVLGRVMGDRRNEDDLLYCEQLYRKSKHAIEGLRSADFLPEKDVTRLKDLETLLRRLEDILPGNLEDGYEGL